MFFFPLLPFCSSSTFKDAERASLRDSGHGDSDQADSDQDTNKGSHCDTSAREALKMKATAVNAQPFEQGEWMYYWHLEVAYQTLVADNIYSLCTRNVHTVHRCFKGNSIDSWLQPVVTFI